MKKIAIGLLFLFIAFIFVWAYSGIPIWESGKPHFRGFISGIGEFFSSEETMQKKSVEQRPGEQLTEHKMTIEVIPDADPDDSAVAVNAEKNVSRFRELLAEAHKIYIQERPASVTKDRRWRTYEKDAGKIYDRIKFLERENKVTAEISHLVQSLRDQNAALYRK